MTTPYFDFITSLIGAAKAEADKLAAHTGHHGLSGEIRELAAKRCIEPFLTQSFRCGSGKVIDSLQNKSDQADIVVYHKRTAPPVFFSGQLGLFPVECVRYVFEVKSTLTATEIRDANKKFRAIAGLKSYPKREADGSITCGSMPATVLLAFSSDIAGDELERYLKYTEDHFPPCVVLCVLGKGYWFFADGKWHGAQVVPNMPPYAEFALFITGLMNTLSSEECTIRPFNPGPYVDAADVILQAMNLKDMDTPPPFFRN
ncbi:DUF6602 domain-containing protein [Trinickia fusca]|uniref:DUF6602 domain-containing protein n=1 Tax=Trinickia fusca TaxID=2419777 RepID=A0A494X8I2_9BURK|nr:DUF6602 domain-containing protein [Trinickia fusca]RKP46858.1 hypothetical protein D7S89_15995 [Trinickia fusca]